MCHSFVNSDFGLWLLLVVNILYFSKQGDADKESPSMDKHGRVQDEVLDNAVQGGEAELERHQDGVGIEGDDTGKATHPSEVTGQEIMQRWLSLRVYVVGIPLINSKNLKLYQAIFV